MDGENRGQRDRAVAHALRSLDPLTGPTAAERRRMRDRVLLALDADANGDEPVPLVATVPPVGDPVPEPRAHAESADEPAPEPPAADAAESTTDGEPDTVTKPVPSRPKRTEPGAITKPVPSRPKRTEPDVVTKPVSPRARSTAEARPTTSRGKTRPEPRRGVLAGARGRFAVASLALLALVGALVGMSVLLARDALPGDALYGVKRTAEAASLGLTFGDEPKALKHLEFAAARLTEIETLARRYPDPADAPVGSYLTALTDFDNDAVAGSRQLITLATSTDGRLLDSLRDWSAQQTARLRQVDRLLPEDARNRASASRGLLDRITARSDALLARMDCYQITSGSYDDIGALPATGQCEENPAATSTTPQPSVSATPDNPGAPAPGGPETPSPSLPPSEPTPEVPPVPVPGATVSLPAPTTGQPDPNGTTTTAPPLIELPPLLPGLPGLGIG